jgi:hypothetical protein
MAGRQGAADRHRRFVNAYVAGGCVNATAAARAAGYTGKEAALAVTASRLLRIAKVRDSIRELSGEALAKANRERAGAIADLAEVLEHTTATMRRGGPDATMAGQHLGLSAAQTLIKHYQDAGIRVRPPGEFGDVLSRLPPEVVAAIARAMLEGRRRALDVGAKAIP